MARFAAGFSLEGRLRHLDPPECLGQYLGEGPGPCRSERDACIWEHQCLSYQAWCRTHEKDPKRTRTWISKKRPFPDFVAELIKKVKVVYGPGTLPRHALQLWGRFQDALEIAVRRESSGKVLLAEGPETANIGDLYVAIGGGMYRTRRIKLKTDGSPGGNIRFDPWIVRYSPTDRLTFDATIQFNVDPVTFLEDFPEAIDLAFRWRMAPKDVEAVRVDPRYVTDFARIAARLAWSQRIPRIQVIRGRLVLAMKGSPRWA